MHAYVYIRMYVLVKEMWYESVLVKFLNDFHNVFLEVGFSRQIYIMFEPGCEISHPGHEMSFNIMNFILTHEILYLSMKLNTQV
jgi:hypothetical protein